MFFAFGGRACGKVEACGDTYVVTTFACVNFMPLAPTGSVLVAGGRSIPIALHPRSVLAAYLRPWSVVLAVWCLFAGFAARAAADAALLLGLAAVFASVALLAWLRLGVLTRRERAEREVYAPYFEGHAADVALLGAAADGMYGKLHAEVVERAQGQLTGTYRSVLDPATQWLDVALDPTVNDADLVRAVFTLARLEEARASGDARRRWRDARARVWQKLEATDRHLIA